MSTTEKQERKLPERKKQFTIQGHPYDVEFPNTGGLMNIENMKVQLSNGQYDSIVLAGTAAGTYSRFLIDMIAVFTTLFPNLKKDMNVKSFSELKVEDSKKLLSIYVKQVLPWFNEWHEFLNADDEDEEEKG